MHRHIGAQYQPGDDILCFNLVLRSLQKVKLRIIVQSGPKVIDMHIFKYGLIAIKLSKRTASFYLVSIIGSG
jgi:hypothetical protein